jgi:hypothetical protein
VAGYPRLTAYFAPLPLPGGFSYSYDMLAIVKIAVTGMTASRSAAYHTSGQANHFPLPRPLSALGGHRYFSSSFRLEVKACRQIQIGTSTKACLKIKTPSRPCSA